MSEIDVYRERARLIALLALFFPTLRAYNDPDEPEWSVVYVDTPAGQLSWHIAPSDVDLFEHVRLVPPEQVKWDGHTTEQKYQRIDRLLIEQTKRARCSS